jgi:hypothetical protein
MSDRYLSRNSLAADVLECAINAFCQSDGYMKSTGHKPINMYDDENGRMISVDEAREVVVQLREINA